MTSSVRHRAGPQHLVNTSAICYNNEGSRHQSASMPLSKMEKIETSKIEASIGAKRTISDKTQLNFGY